MISFLLSLSPGQWLNAVGIVLVLLGVAFGFFMKPKEYRRSNDPSDLLSINEFKNGNWSSVKRSKRWAAFWEYVLIIGLGLELWAFKASISDDLKLQQKIEELRESNNADEAMNIPRILQFDRTAFRDALKGKSRCAIEILYPKDDVEAYDLAEAICLDLNSEGWTVLSLPRPLVEADLTPNQQLGNDGSPLLRRMGVAWGGFAIVSRDTPELKTNSVGYELQMAISAGFGYGAYGNTMFFGTTDERLPENFVRLTVGAGYSGVNWKNRKLRNSK